MNKNEIQAEIQRLKAERSRIERRLEELKNASRVVGDCVYSFENGKHILSLRPDNNRISEINRTRKLVIQGSKTLFLSEMEKLIKDLTELHDRVKGGEVEK